MPDERVFGLSPLTPWLKEHLAKFDSQPSFESLGDLRKQRDAEELAERELLFETAIEAMDNYWILFIYQVMGWQPRSASEATLAVRLYRLYVKGEDYRGEVDPFATTADLRSAKARLREVCFHDGTGESGGGQGTYGESTWTTTDSSSE